MLCSVWCCEWAEACCWDSRLLRSYTCAVVILVAGMPSAVTAVIFAAEAGLDEELVASIVALSVVVGVVLLPWLPQVAHWLMR